jgi:hypothetical protein
MRYIITQHAIEQFISRWSPAKTRKEAEGELQSLLHTSTYSGQSLSGGRVMVSSYRPEIRMVVKDSNVCITVLPLYQPPSNDVQACIDEIVEMELERQEENQSSAQDYVDEMVEIGLAYELAIERAEFEILRHKQELEKVNNERLALGQRKVEIMANIRMLQSDIQRMQSASRLPQ